MPLAERRSYPRKHTRGAVRAWMCELHRKPEKCFVVEISRKGALVKCPRALPLRTVVQFAFAYERGKHATRLFRRWMRVVRHTASGFALEFVDLPPETKVTRRSAPL